ncbi:hypothetical protein GOP47_0017072, partial [Adiantum capillus-veneris]
KEYSEHLLGNKDITISAICLEGDDTPVQVIIGNVPHSISSAAQRMDWREASFCCYCSTKSVDPTWVAAMRQYFFMDTKRVDNLSRCGLHDPLGVRMYIEEFFEFPTVRTFGQGNEVELLQSNEVGSFCASLVFPAEVLVRPETGTPARDNLGFEFEAVAVEGDCASSNEPVTKIGCFS